MPGTMRRLALIVVVAIAACVSSIDVSAWGAQGHRLVALIAAERLTPVAKQQAAWLLDGQTLADVANWADSFKYDQQQTTFWHFADIPLDAAGYDRDRDCPVQQGVQKGSRDDRWRDCAVDRIGYWEERLANPKLDRADRATALKYLVHFIADLHQPFHALAVGRGGNDVRVKWFGQFECNNPPAAGTPRADRQVPCNLHAVWDSRLIDRRSLNDGDYVSALRTVIADRELARVPVGTPAQWAEQSFKLAREALVANDANIDEAYYRRHITVIDERLALGGLRLAAELNRLLPTPPPR